MSKFHRKPIISLQEKKKNAQEMLKMTLALCIQNHSGVFHHSILKTNLWALDADSFNPAILYFYYHIALTKIMSKK